jgi:hypothetical protein
MKCYKAELNKNNNSIYVFKDTKFTYSKKNYSLADISVTNFFVFGEANLT